MARQRRSGSLLRCLVIAVCVCTLLGFWSSYLRLHIGATLQEFSSTSTPSPPRPLQHPPSPTPQHNRVVALEAVQRANMAWTGGGCARVRPGHLLIYAAHSGFGNQELSLRRALLVAYVTNRTLVLPPILRQSDLAFGVPEVRCRNASWYAYLQARAEQLYASKLQTRGEYESLLQAYEFAELRRLGMSVIDYAKLSAVARARLASAPLAPLGCAKHDKYTAINLRMHLNALHSSEALRMGTAYFLRANVDGLRSTDRCFEAVYRAVLRLPLSPQVRRVSEVALQTLTGPFASTHLRLSDGGIIVRGQDGSVAEAAADLGLQLHRDIDWLSHRLAKRLKVSSCGLFVATNVPDGVRSPLLADLCKSDSQEASTLGSHLSNSHLWNCSDLTSIRLSQTTEWREMRSSSGLSATTASMLVEQHIASMAPKGFFATSKFCGPPGFRRSTFSEGIALRWAQQHRAAPLCAHAMEHALPKGMAAHSTFVY